MQPTYLPLAIVKAGSKGNDGMDGLRKKAYLSAMNGKVRNLLSVCNDAKTIKGEKYGVRTAVMYMAPASASGFEVCPSRTVGCSAACLFTAGQGRFPNVKQGRLRRTYQFLFRRQEFFEQLAKEIYLENEKALEDGKQFCVRLNGTSDIAYEHERFKLFGEVYENIFRLFPDIQFYDYTKRIERLSWIKLIDNYYITFSRAETRRSHEDVEKALALGINVTIVFREELPAMWHGMPVVDGDRHDIRFWDGLKHGGKPVIIGLLAKGNAKFDDSGFVID